MAVSQLGTGVALTNQTVASGHGSWSHTLAAGSDRIVYVTLGIETAQNITGLAVTYGGVSATGILRVEQGTGFENNSAIAYWLEADLPSNGSNAVVVTWTGPSSSTEWSGWCNSIQDAEQEAPTTGSDNGGNTTSGSVTISPAADDWVVGVLSLGSTATPSAANGETTEATFDDSSSRFRSYAFDPAGGSETALGATYASTNRMTLAVATFAQASGGATQDLQPGLLASSASIFAPTVTTLATVQPGLLASSATFFSPTVTTSVSVSPPLLASAASFFSPTVSVGGVSLAPGLLASAASFFAPAVTTGAVSLSPGLLASSAAIFSPTVAHDISEFTEDLNGGGMTIGLPGHSEGDTLIVFATQTDSGSGGGAMEAPDSGTLTTDYTLRQARTGNTKSQWSGVYTRTAGASESNPTATWDNEGTDPENGVLAIALPVSGTFAAVQFNREDDSTDPYDFDFDGSVDADAGDWVVYVALVNSSSVPTFTDNGGDAIFGAAVEIGDGDGHIVMAYEEVASDGIVTNPGFTAEGPGTLDFTGYVIHLQTATTLLPGLLASSASFFSPTVTTGNVNVAPGLLASAASFFAPTITTAASVSPPLLASAASFFSATVTTGAVTLQPPLLASAASFFAATVLQQQLVQPGLLASSATFFSATVTTGAVSIAPPLLESSATFFSATVTTGAQLATQLLESAATFFAATITTGGVDVAPGLLASAAEFYSPTIGLYVEPGLLASAASFFAPAVTTGAVSLSPGLLASSASFFAPTVAAGTVNVAPPLLASAASFFAPTVTGTTSLAPSLVESAATFFAATVTTGVVSIAPPLLASAAAFFSPTVALAAQLVAPPLLASSASFFSPTVTQDLVVAPSSMLASNAAFFQHRIKVAGAAEAIYAALSPREQFKKAPSPTAEKRRLRPPFNIKNWDVPAKHHHLGVQLSQLATYTVEQLPGQVRELLATDDDLQIIILDGIKNPQNTFVPGFDTNGGDVFIQSGNFSVATNIYGMQVGREGMIVWIHNSDAEQSLYLHHDSPNTSFITGFFLQNDAVQEIPPGATFGFIRIQARWVPIQVSERGRRVAIALSLSSYDNWDPGVTLAHSPWTFALSASGDVTITGITPGVEGQVITLENRDVADIVTLAYNSSSSDAEARILAPRFTDYRIMPYDAVSLVYSGDKWRVIDRNIDTGVFVWDESGTLRETNVIYHTWTAAHAAAEVFGGPCDIALYSNDDEATFTLPTGSWDMGSQIGIRSWGLDYTLAFPASTRLRHIQRIIAGQALTQTIVGQGSIEYRGQRLTLTDLATSGSPTYQACIDNSVEEGEGLVLRNVRFGAHSGSSKHYVHTSSGSSYEAQLVLHDCELANARILRSDGNAHVRVRGALTSFGGRTDLFLCETAADHLTLTIEDGAIASLSPSWDSTWTGASGTSSINHAHEAQYTEYDGSGTWPSGTDPDDVQDAIEQNNAMAARVVLPTVITVALTSSPSGFDPTDWDTCDVCFLTPDSDTYSILGFQAPTADGTRIRRIVNASSSDDFSLLHNQGAADAEDRILLPDGATHTVGPLHSFTIIYRDSLSRWYLLSAT